MKKLKELDEKNYDQLGELTVKELVDYIKKLRMRDYAHKRQITGYRFDMKRLRDRLDNYIEIKENFNKAVEQGIAMERRQEYEMMMKLLEKWLTKR